MLGSLPAITACLSTPCCIATGPGARGAICRRAFRVVHTRFSRWARTEVWARVFETLAADADHEYAMLDSTIVRAHQHSAGAQKAGGDQAIGRSKGA